MQLLDVFKMIDTLDPFRGRHEPRLDSVSVLIAVDGLGSGRHAVAMPMPVPITLTAVLVAGLALVGSIAERRSEVAKSCSLQALIEDRHVAA